MLFRSQKDYRWWSSFLTYFIPLALATIGILTLFAWFDNRHQIDLLKSQAVAKHILLQQGKLYKRRVLSDAIDQALVHSKKEEIEGKSS
jgi:hypothetical protein